MHTTATDRCEACEAGRRRRWPLIGRCGLSALPGRDTAEHRTRRAAPRPPAYAAHHTSRCTTDSVRPHRRCLRPNICGSRRIFSACTSQRAGRCPRIRMTARWIFPILYNLSRDATKLPLTLGGPGLHLVDGSLNPPESIISQTALRSVYR